MHNNRHEPTSGPQQPFKCFKGGEEDRSSDGNDSDDDGDDDDDDDKPLIRSGRGRPRQ